MRQKHFAQRKYTDIFTPHHFCQLNMETTSTLLTFLIILFYSVSTNAQSFQINSPDGNLSFQLNIQDQNEIEKALFYDVYYKNQPVSAGSQIDLLLYDNLHLCQYLELVNQEKTDSDTTWTPVYGEWSQIRDHYRQLRVTLKNTRHNRTFNLLAKAYNSGVAFSYEFPEDFGYGILEISNELTHFSFPEGTRAWHTPRAQSEYSLKPLQNWDHESERPITLELPNGLFAAVGEAQMVNYARMKLKLSEQYPTTMVSSLASKVVESSPFQTPWRVIMVAENAGDLIMNNTIFLNLNPPRKIENPWWIRPGKVIREVTLSTDGAKAAADFASEHGLDFIHFDAGWYGYEYTVDSDPTTITVDPRRNPEGDLDLHEAIRYAKSKGLGVFVYVNRRALERHLDEILPLYKSWGIDGIKYGFVQVGTHRWTTWLHDAVRKAADHQLMVNVHDEYRPTGFSRTYPNFMTQEGILGNEAMPSATHNTILPFTRFLSGPADYTIAYYYRKEFGQQNKFIKGTPAHQLALAVVYYSPLQWLYWYDKPSDYQGEPEIEFFDAVPTVWDDTRFIDGKIGEYIIMARKDGEEWYLGAITNDSSRQVEIPLDFLDESRNYQAHIYTDGGEKVKTRTHVAIDTRKVKPNDRLKFELKESGGVAVRFIPVLVK